MDVTLAAIALLPGLALGSFLNVVAARVPLRRSIVKPGSACMACGTPLAWYDNVPLLSFALLRGRCRHCETAIPWRYPLVELDDGAPRRRLRPPSSGSPGTPPSPRSSAPRSSPSRRPTSSGASSRTGSSCRPPPSCSPRKRCSTRRSSGRSAGLGAALFLFVAALAYPGGHGHGRRQARAAARRRARARRSGRADGRDGERARAVDRPVRAARPGRAQDEDPVRAVPRLRRRRRASSPGSAMLDAYLGLL